MENTKDYIILNFTYIKFKNKAKKSLFRGVCLSSKTKKQRCNYHKTKDIISNSKRALNMDKTQGGLLIDHFILLLYCTFMFYVLCICYIYNEEIF